MLKRVYHWFDRNVLELGRELRLSYLAAGVSGLAAIVGTFFVKDYLGLSAEFLAPTGYVVQDLVADAMTVEAVPTVDQKGNPFAPEAKRLMHTTMQTLGRGATIGGGVFVALLNVFLSTALRAMCPSRSAARSKSPACTSRKPSLARTPLRVGGVEGPADTEPTPPGPAPRRPRRHWGRTAATRPVPDRSGPTVQRRTDGRRRSAPGNRRDCRQTLAPSRLRRRRGHSPRSGQAWTCCRCS